MGLDVVAVSRVHPEEPEILELEEFGVVSGEFITEISPTSVSHGYWIGPEPGRYRSGADSRRLHHRIGSYRYYADWRSQCWLIEPQAGLSHLLVHNDCDGGWGAEVAAEIHEELVRRREEAVRVWRAHVPGEAGSLISTWDQFTELSKIAADGGLLMLC
jgi:hypothetical protein